MSKELQIKNGNLVACFDLENEDGDIDFCTLFKISHGVAEEIGKFIDNYAVIKIIKDKSNQINDLQTQLDQQVEENKKLYNALKKERQEKFDAQVDRHIKEDVVKRMRKLQLQLEKSNIRWKKLKEWVDEQSFKHDKGYRTVVFKDELQRKMQELEQGEKDDETGPNRTKQDKARQ